MASSVGARRTRRFGAALLLAAVAMVTPFAAYGGTWVSPAVIRDASAGPPPCGAGATCVNVDATRALGPVDLVAQGLLFGIDGTTDPAIVDALHPTSWRLSGDSQSFGVARSSGAVVTDVLSNQWYDSHNNGHPDPPWNDWAAYATWIRQVVTQTAQSGQLPDYWEVQNEPDGWYQSLPPESTTQALYQYQLAATIIRSVLPHARIEGPSLLGWFATPGQPTLDMKTFLDFVNAHNLPLDALSWHEVIGTAVDRNPDVVIAHVAQARVLLSHYPRLAHLPIFINEYAANDSHLIPGWAVGWISAIEDAGVAQATRACWHEPDVLGKPIAECNEGSLDGLVQPGSGLPQDLYWVHWMYGQMLGNRIATSSTDPNVSAYATYDPSNSRIAVLIGRHASCTAAVRVDCTQKASATPGPKGVTLRIKTPAGWTSALVASLQIRNVPGPMVFPAATVNGVFGTSPAVTVPIPSVADGDAYAFVASEG